MALRFLVHVNLEALLLLLRRIRVIVGGNCFTIDLWMGLGNRLPIARSRWCRRQRPGELRASHGTVCEGRVTAGRGMRDSRILSDTLNRPDQRQGDRPKGDKGGKGGRKGKGFKLSLKIFGWSTASILREDLFSPKVQKMEKAWWFNNVDWVWLLDSVPGHS